MNSAGVAARESDFLKALGVDAKRIEQLRANAGANLILSGVTQKPRRVVWQQGPLGGVYSTLDVERVAAERDPLRRPLSADGLAFEYDASEWFATARQWHVAHCAVRPRGPACKTACPIASPKTPATPLAMALSFPCSPASAAIAKAACGRSATISIPC